MAQQKLQPKETTYEKWEKFRQSAKKDGWHFAWRYGWGFSAETEERIKGIENDPEPLLLHIKDVPTHVAEYEYAIVSDKIKFAITVSPEHLDKFFKKFLPNFEPEV